ncbi:MAG: hypothetical protein HWN68_10010 [Desulfobacterales bacterium]|nr:hypothetical protein [Desulfobacterales bacterium]
MAKMFRKTGLPRVTVKDPNVKQWATRLSKTLDDLQTEQAKQYTTYIDEQITNVTNNLNTEITNIENNYGIMLAGEDGSIFYAWKGEIEELPHGIYGQVLVTGGHGQRPFWDWVWKAPGAETATAFVIDCIVESSVATDKPTMDYTSDQGDAAISSDFVSSEGPQPQLFEEWDFEVSSSNTAVKVSMDHIVSLTVDTGYGELKYGEGLYGGDNGLVVEIITSVT